MSGLPLSTPLGDAIAYIQGLMETPKGTRCPCCNRKVKVYRRTIHHQMAVGLIRLTKEGEGFHHLPSLETDVRGGDTTKLAYWGLIEEELILRPDGGRAGYWRVTPLGRRFVMGFVTVPQNAMVYNETVLRYEGGQWSIHDALGHRFDLNELL